MKKKFLLVLAIMSLLVCVFAISVSAATPEQYIEFKVMLEGDSQYTTVYSTNDYDYYTPRLSLARDFFTEPEQINLVDKSKIVKFDLSEPEVYGCRNSYIKQLGASSQPFVNVTEIKMPAYTDVTVNIPTSFCKNWSSLKTVDFGTAVEIWDNAFEGCGFVEITVPEQIVRFANNLFMNCKSLQKVTIEGTGEKNIGTSMFSGCSSLTDVTLVKLAGIGGSMFYGCSNLTQITIPETATFIGNSAFLLTKLESLHVPAAVKSLGYQLVEDVATFKSITFAENSQLTSIGHRMFRGTAITGEIVIPANVTSIGYEAFAGATGINSIVLPEGLTKIDNSLFSGCTSLQSVYIPSTVKKIGGSAFNNTAIASITLPSALESLDKAAFYNCKSLTHVYNLENTSVTWMGESFLGCSSLIYVRLPKGLVTFEANGDGTFRNCSSLTDVGEMPVTLEFIGKNSFAGSGLSGVLDFSKCTKLTTFQGGTFSSTKISKVILSPSITDLGDHTFTSCPNLEEIVGLEFINVPELRGNLIEGKNKVTELRLPISASDGMLEVGNLLWDRPSNAPITVYVANANVKFDGIYYKTGCKINIVYCGDDYDKFFENSPTAKANVGENIFPVDTEIDTTKHSLTYGNNLCVVFYDGEHAQGEILNQCQFGCGRNCGMVELLENPQHELSKVTAFGEKGYFDVACITESCSICKTVTLNESIEALFVSYGYSMTEVEIGGKLSMSQFFGIDKTNLEKYTTLTGNAFEYGFVVSSNADPMSEANSGLIAEGKTYITTQNGFKHDYFAVAVVGFTDATLDNALTFCVYVKDGAKVSYLDNGETVETVNMKSYNQIKALLVK